MMNKHFRLSKTVLALIAVSTVGLSLPVRADEALIQETVQESYTTGEGNVSVQSSSQQNRQYSEKGRHNYRDRDSVGIVQRSDQFCDQYGEGNVCVQDAQQRNTSRQRRSRF